LVLIGPPGAGKSTIADLLAHQLPVKIIATGKLLRAEIAAQTDIGRQIGPLLDQGQFAPDEIIDRLMHQWMDGIPQDHGFILDGYPRSGSQAETLNVLLAEFSRPLDLIISLELSEGEAVRRLSGRRICEGGGEPFTLHIEDEAAVARCVARGGTLAMRDDDQPEVIVERMRVFDKETEPLLDFYADSGLLRSVDAHGTPEAVVQRVLALVRAVP
jgi:adenylate kinase